MRALKHLAFTRSRRARVPSVSQAQRDDGECRDTLAAPDEPDPLARGGLHVDASWRQAKNTGQALADRVTVRDELGALHNDRAVHVDKLKSLRDDTREHRLQQLDRIGVAVALVAVGEVLADVTKAGSTQQSVNHRVREHVGVGMAVKAKLAGDLNAAQDESAPWGQPVGVVADAAERRHRAMPAPIGSKRRSRRSNTHSSLTFALSSSSSARS